MINPQDFMNEQKASQMLSQGVPIENIVRDTGVPRNRVTAMLQNQGLEQSFVNSQQAPVMPNQASSGIPSLGDQVNPDVASVISPQESQELGDDFAEYITDDLGFDPLTNDITDNPNKRQETGQTDALNMLENPSQQSVQDIIKTRGDILASDPTDFDMDQIYKAAEILQGKLKYGEDIPKPSEGLPWLLLADKLIKGGTQGDDWATALSSGALAYFTAKKTGEINYKKELRAGDTQKFSDYNSLVMQFGMLDFKNKAAINAALRKSNLEAPKMYDISNNSTFTDKLAIPLSDAEFNYYAGQKEFQGKIRPSKNADVEAMSIYSPDGGISHVLIDQDSINAWDPARQGGATLREGHKDPTNLKLYNVFKDGEQQPQRWLTPAGMEKLNTDGFTTNFAPTSGAPKYVINKESGEGVYVTDQQILDNPDLYMDDSGISMFQGSDGSIEFTSGSAGLQRQRERRGTNAYDDLVDKATGIQQATFNYFDSAAETDRILTDYLTANPGQQNIPFNNLVGAAAKIGDSLRINFEGFRNAFTEYGTYVVDGKKGASIDEMRAKVLGSDEFKKFLGTEENRTGVAKFFEDAGVVGDALEAALFDLALVGAGAYGGKGTTDLRAISDREMISFIGIQGGNAKSLQAFMEISNSFRRKTIARNRNSLDTIIKPTNLRKITDANGQPDKASQDALIADVNKTLAQLDKYEELYQSTYVYGQTRTASDFTNTNTFVADASGEEDIPGVVEFNANISADSPVGQQYGLTKDYTLLDSNEILGTYRQMINQYEYYSNDAEYLSGYYDQLKTHLSPEEFNAFRIFYKKAQDAKAGN